MKSPVIILGGLFASAYYADLDADTLFEGVLAPLGVFVFLVMFCIWLVLRAGFDRRVDRGGFGGGGDIDF